MLNDLIDELTFNQTRSMLYHASISTEVIKKLEMLSSNVNFVDKNSFVYKNIDL